MGAYCGVLLFEDLTRQIIMTVLMLLQ